MRERHAQLPELLKSLEAAAKPLLELQDVKLTSANLEQYGVHNSIIKMILKKNARHSLSEVFNFLTER
jgi:hypothetical protein